MTRAALAACALALAACDKPAPAPPPPSPTAVAVVAQPENGPLAPRRATPPGQVEPPQLPEDPVAAAQATAQWREHLDHEEEERQAAFDRPRRAQHRAVLRRLTALRTRYDRANSEPAVAKVRAAAERELVDVQKRVNEIDPLGNNSRLLGDYAALSASLGDEYAAARVAAIRGDTAALGKVRGELDARTEKAREWLEELEHEHEHEHEQKE